jgi:4-amino-4-deoxychorismate lyase
MSENVLWLNGDFLPAAEARLPALDHAVQFGAGLFETFRTWDGRAALLPRHLARMRCGCRAYRIEPPNSALLPQSEIRLPAILRELLERNTCTDAVFRYTVTAGTAPAGLPVAPYRQPSEMVVLRPIPSSPPNGRTLHLLATRRMAPETMPRPKSLQYGNALMGRLEMLDRGLVTAGSEGLMLTPEGWLAEGVTTSLFFLHEGRLCTPALNLGILPGVAREVALELARAEGLPVCEGAFPTTSLTQSEMIFLTSGALGLAPVREVFDSTGRKMVEVATQDHPQFRRLSERFHALVSG